MIGQRDGALPSHARFRVIVRVRPDGVYIAFLLQVVEDMLDAFIHPRVRLHLNRDKVLPVFGGVAVDLRSGFGLGR
jgi:hypothetical protein